MATLKEGLYHIRFVPPAIKPHFVGGLYVTATEIGEPILAEAGHDKGLQTWQVRRNPNGKYVITQPGFKTKFAGIGPVLMGWSLQNPSLKFPGGDILFKVDYMELELKPTLDEEIVVYGVKVPNPEGMHFATLDCEFYVTVDDHKVVSKAFWSSLRINAPHPHWQFIPAK